MVRSVLPDDGGIDRDIYRYCRYAIFVDCRHHLGWRLQAVTLRVTHQYQRLPASIRLYRLLYKFLIFHMSKSRFNAGEIGRLEFR